MWTVKVELMYWDKIIRPGYWGSSGRPYQRDDQGWRNRTADRFTFNYLLYVFYGGGDDPRLDDWGLLGAREKEGKKSVNRHLKNIYIYRRVDFFCCCFLSSDVLCLDNWELLVTRMKESNTLTDAFENLSPSSFSFSVFFSFWESDVLCPA